MGNFDFFSQISGIYASFFAIICLVFSGFMVLKDKRLVYPVICLIVALILDFFATCIAARSSVLFEAGFDIKTHVMFELLLLLLSMFFMSLSATMFMFKKTEPRYFLPVWILSGLGFFAVILFTVISPAGDVVNNMRQIFPLTGFAYLLIGLAPGCSSPSPSGYITAFACTSFAIIIVMLKCFHIYAPWYLTPILYIGFAVSLLLIKAGELAGRLQKAEAEILKYNRRIENIMMSSPFPIIISRLSDDSIVTANDNAIRIFGLDEENLGNNRLKDFFADSDNRRLFSDALEEEKEVKDFEVLIKSDTSEAPFWLLASASVIDYNNDVVLYSAFQDITSRKNREALLQNQASRDPLTSIYNRRYFEEEVKKQITKLKKAKTPFSVLMIDADHFKKVNDNYGHKIGDKVLIELAAKIEKDLRDQDIVARYGGEEFVVFLPESTSEQAQKVAERLRESISHIVVRTDDNQEVRFTVSVGVTSSNISENIETLIKTADEALYKAKQNGRNRVATFTMKDLVEYEKKGAQSIKEERKHQHPIYDDENTAEFSLLDGSNTNKHEDSL